MICFFNVTLKMATHNSCSFPQLYGNSIILDFKDKKMDKKWNANSSLSVSQWNCRILYVLNERYITTLKLIKKTRKNQKNPVRECFTPFHFTKHIYLDCYICSFKFRGSRSPLWFYICGGKWSKGHEAYNSKTRRGFRRKISVSRTKQEREKKRSLGY